ncbi:hypothetical protein Aduo_014705 [Ancylostoma duodenale]
MNGAYRARVFSRDGCSPPWMDPRHGSARSSPFTSPAPASTSDSCDLLIEDDRGTSFTRNSLFLFDDEVDMDNEIVNASTEPRYYNFTAPHGVLRGHPETSWITANPISSGIADIGQKLYWL